MILNGITKPATFFQKGFLQKHSHAQQDNQGWSMYFSALIHERMKSTRCLKIRSLLRKDGIGYRANLQANAAINTRIKINPVKICPFFIFPSSWIDAGNRTSINTVSNALADIGDDRVCHNCWLSYVGNLIRQPVDGVAPRGLQTLIGFFTISTRPEITLGDLSLGMPARLFQQSLFKC